MTLTDTAAFRTGLDRHLTPPDPIDEPPCESCGCEYEDGHGTNIDGSCDCGCKTYVEPTPCPTCNAVDCHCDADYDAYRDRLDYMGETA